MGMVFTQQLYIDFCNPNADVQNKWECPEFEQLLHQIGQYLNQDTVGALSLIEFRGVVSIL